MDIKLNSIWKPKYMLNVWRYDLEVYKVVKTWKVNGSPMVGIQKINSTDDYPYKVSRSVFLREFTKISKLQTYLEQLDV